MSEFDINALSDEDKGFLQRIQQGRTYNERDFTYTPLPTYSQNPPSEAEAAKITSVSYLKAFDWDHPGDSIAEGVTQLWKQAWNILTGNNAPDEARLQDAEKIGSALNMSPTMLAGSPEVFDMAAREYERQRKLAAAQGQPFSPQSIQNTYPELGDIASEDPVKAAAALHNYEEIQALRRLTDEANAAMNAWSIMKEGYQEGNEDYALALKGNALRRAEFMDDEDKAAQIQKDIDRQLAKLQGRKEEKSLLGSVFKETSKQIGQYVSGSGTIAKGAATGGMAGAMAGSVIPGMGTGAGALSGAVLGAKTGLAKFTYDMEGGIQYIQERQAGMSKNWAAGSSVVTGTANAAAELFGLKYFMKLSGLSSVYGTLFRKQLGKAAISDIVKEAGRAKLDQSAKALIGNRMLRAAIAATPELVEESVQQANGMLIHNAAVALSGEDLKTYSGKEIMDESIDAAFQALPAVVGMTLPTAILSSVGHAVAMKRISRREIDEAKEIYARRNEANLGAKLLQMRPNLALFKKFPDVFGKTVQKQMDRAGMGTMYIDAANAAETVEGQQALNTLVENGITTEQELNDAISNGSQLEVGSGAYFQSIPDEKVHEVLQGYTTMNKDGQTMRDIQEHAEQIRQFVRKVQTGMAEKESQVINDIINRDFKERTDGLYTDDKRDERAVAEDVLSRGLSHIRSNYKAALQEAKDIWGDLAGVRSYQNYKPGGVGIIDTIGEGGQYETKRFSGNEGWYSGWFKEHGKKPTDRDLYDIAHEYAMGEAEAKGEIAEVEKLEAAKKRVETLEGMEHYFNTLNTRDLLARKTLSKEAYEKLYAPTIEELKKAPKAVRKAAADSALIYTRIADIFHKDYGTPYEDFARIAVGAETGRNAYGQMAGRHALTADRMKLQKAQDLEVEGKSAETIWNETGWLKGKDGKWRFEIPDKLDSIHLGNYGEGSRIFLSVLYDNPKLYEAYPELETTVVRFEDLGNKVWGYATRGAITLNTKRIKENQEQAKKTLVHEIQHIIQDREGFAVGGDLRSNSPEDLQHYQNLAGEQEARETEHRAGQQQKANDRQKSLAKAQAAYDQIRGELEPETQKKMDQYVTFSLKDHNGTATMEELLSLFDAADGLNERQRNIADTLIDAKEGAEKAKMGMPHPHDSNAIVKFGDAELPYSQRADDKDYVVYHNVSEENLMKMAKLGGLPVPSIAVTRKGIPFSQFGGITLIGTKDLVDPERGTDVWSRDAYTTRFPELVYDAPKEKKMNAFVAQNKKAFGAIGEENELDRIRSSILYTSDPMLAERELGPSRGMMYRYVTEELGESVQIPMKNEENTVYPEIMDEDVKQAIRNMKEPPQPGTPPYEELSRKIEKAMEASFERMANGGFGKRWSEEKKKERAKLYRNRYLDEEGNVKLSIADRMYGSMHEEAERIIDTGALDTELHSKIDNDKYMAWIRKELDTLFDAPKLQIGRKKVPLTLSNVVEAMTKKQGAGKEMGFTVSDNNVLAKGSQKFKTIKEMKEARDRIVTNEEGKAAYDEFVNALSAFREEGEKNFSGDLWHESDAANMALGDAIKAGGTKAKLAAALRKQGFKGITAQSEMVAKGMAAIEAAKKVKTDYFEAKPARSVSFNEFKGAVVPKGTSQETINFLKDQNMRIAEYDPDKPGDRQEKQEQIATQTGVYFQRAWYGSPYTFENFDLGKIGSGEGNQVHGWGLYFAKDKKVAESYKDVFGGTKGDEHQASIYEVEVPEDTVLLDEEKDFNAQPKKVKAAIQKLIKNLTDEELENAGEDVSWEGRTVAIKNVMEMLKDFDGKGIYNTLYDIFGGDKEASLKLNEYGVKGIAYGGREDGRCFVVFDDKAIQIIQRYNQTVTMGDIAKQKLAADEAQWKTELEKLPEPGQQSTQNAGRPIHVMTTPLAFRLLGQNVMGRDPQLPIVIDVSKLQLLRKEHPAMTIPVLEQIPQALANPIMMCGSLTQAGRVVSVLELKDEMGRNVLVPFALDQRKGRVEANIITSIYGREGTNRNDFSWIRKEISANRLLYIDRTRAYKILGMKKSKATAFLQSAGVRFPMEAKKSNGLLNIKIPDESDLVKLWNAHPSMYQGDEHIGAFDPNKNLIALFNGANQSTVIHETAHMWLTMLTRVAQDGNEKARKDLQTIRSWASFTEDNIKEYAGTSLEDEFSDYAAKLRQNPNDLATQDRYMQERFARGFERYLMTGSAPTKELRDVFRRFKRWLLAIYRDIQNLGTKEAPKNVQAIFDRMLAVDDEINAWSDERRLESIDKAYDFTKTEEENINAWAKNVRETAKERVLANLQKQATTTLKESLERAIPDMRRLYMDELRKENPIYNLEIAYNSDSLSDRAKMDLLQSKGYKTTGEFSDAIQEAGGSIFDRTDAYIKEQRELAERELLNPDRIRESAEAELQSAEGKSQRSLIEMKSMRSMLNRHIHQIRAAQVQLGRHPESTAEIKERLGLLTDEEKKNQSEKKERKTAKDLQTQLKNMADGIRQAAQILDAPIREINLNARIQLAQAKVSQAISWKWWDNRAGQAERKSARALARGQWAEAASAKRSQLTYSAMAKAAKENEAEVRRSLQGNPKATTTFVTEEGMEKYGILGMLNRIGRKKDPIRMEENTRYFLQHMAYQLGIVKEDGILPINEQGKFIEMNWEKIYKLLDTDRALDQGEQPNNELIAPWLRVIFDKHERTAYDTLTMEQFRDVINAMKALYNLGRREYDPHTWEGKSFDDVAAELINQPQYVHRGNSMDKRLGQTKIGEWIEAAGDAVMDAARADVILERMGKRWKEIIYDPIDRADMHEMRLREYAKKEAAKNFKIYSSMEWAKIRGEHAYSLPGMRELVTKETILSVALNWGTKDNRARILETFGLREEEAVLIENKLMEYMDDKDWEFVQGVWRHINSFWEQDNAAFKRQYGQPLGKVPGIRFKINGKEIQGGYYPIVYDPQLGKKASDRDINDALRAQMAGGASFALGMNSTKMRKLSSGGQKVYLYLDVYTRHLDEVVHRIPMREAITDVYKLLNREDVSQAIQEQLGKAGYDLLTKWAQDVWTPPMERLGPIGNAIRNMTRKASFAVMAYRTSTAVLNVSQLAVMMAYMGPVRALHAFVKFHCGKGSHIGSALRLDMKNTFRVCSENRDFVLRHSVFMRERANTMDKDMAQALAIPMKRNTTKLDAWTEMMYEPVRRASYKLIAETDLMFSLTQWKYIYDETMADCMQKDMRVEDAEAKAVQAADEAVRYCFGSSRMKDLTGIQKDKFVMNFVPFYSWASTILNLFIRAGYKFTDRHSQMELINAMLYGWIFQAAMDSLVRSWTNGDDEDELKKRLASSIISGGPIQGIPLFRDFVQTTAEIVTGQKVYNSGSNVLGSAIVMEANRTIQAAYSSKKDWTDVGRGISRTTNRIIGFPDTLSDGFWTMMKVLFTDTEADFWDVVYAIIFDKQIKKEKKGDKK